MGKLTINEETYGLIWGTIFLVIGLVVLLFVFANVLAIIDNPSEKLEQWVPEEVTGPTANFEWWAKDKSVEFNDLSLKGSAEITNWNWDFGDGSSSSDQNPNHEYTTSNDYTVTLEVEDGNGNTHSARTRVSVLEGESNEGQTQTGMALDLGLDAMLNRIPILILYLVAFAILVMIGGRFLVAGCRLIRPNIKYLKVKMKPKDIDKDNNPK